MNRAQLNELMDKTQAYHEAYLKAYKKSKENSKSNKSKKNLLPFLIFISIPFIFSVFLNILFLIGKSSEPKIAFNKYNNFSDEIIYDNIFESDLIYEDNYNTSKFEEVVQNHRNNLLNKFGLLEKFISPTDSISLKKINLPNNISERKKEFINIVLPIIVDQNRQIIVLRQKLIDSKNYLNQNKTLSQTDQIFINNLATKYSVATKNRHKVDIINDLLFSVDIIPNSIALAQAANESGWGSSRFAIEYNALFGESTYDSKAGIVPFEREEGKKHLVRYFQTLDQSVESYFKNINSHYAYDRFRKLRKILRDQKSPFNIILLVNKLDVYAEDEGYVDTIVSIIQDNKFTQYDNILFLLTES